MKYSVNGLIIPVGIRYVRQHLPTLLEDAENALSPIAREVFSSLYDELLEVDKRLEDYTNMVAPFIGPPLSACNTN